MKTKIFISLLCMVNISLMAQESIDASISQNKELKGQTSKVRFDMENGYPCVDLGLSVRWATCNIGAFQPEEYGNYYAWGETEVKEQYDWSTYQHANREKNKLTKYCNSFQYGDDDFTDDKDLLDLEDDAAHTNWGGEWRIPTENEWKELCMKCKWEWIKKNGTNGYRITASNGNAIFLPAAGYRNETEFFDVGSYGDYWSSSLGAGHAYYAWHLFFRSGMVGSLYYYNRFYGNPIRPVCP